MTRLIVALLTAALSVAITAPPRHAEPAPAAPAVVERNEVGIFDRLRARRNPACPAAWFVEAPQAAAQPVPAPAPAAPKKFPRGAKPSPRFKLQAATPFRATAAAPAQFAIVPPKLSMWFNDTYGDCVTAEEAFAKAVWSIQCGLPELFVPDAEVKRWASAHGVLNGADLSEVMDAMQTDPFNVDGKKYTDGKYFGVDYSNESVLQAAIAQGPVKVAVSGDAFPDGAGNENGWYAQGGRFPNTDHCVSICGYGPAAFLFKQFGMDVPAGFTAQSGYLVFSWSTVGVVDFPWIQGTVVEAWVRNPTTPGQSPQPPKPPDPPQPPAGGYTITIPPGLAPGSYTVGNGSPLTADEAATLKALVAKVTGDGPAPAPDVPPAGFTEDKQLTAGLIDAIKAKHPILGRLIERNPDSHRFVMSKVYGKLAETPEGQKLFRDYKAGALPPGWFQTFLDLVVKYLPQILAILLPLFGL